MIINWTAVLGRFALGVGIVLVVAALGSLAFGVRDREITISVEQGRLRIGVEGRTAGPGQKSSQEDQVCQEAKRGQESAGKSIPPEEHQAVYQVVRVMDDDTLAVRVAADPNSKLVGRIPPNGKDIIGTGKQKKYGRYTWVEVQWGKCVRGWANSHYLEPVA